MTEIQRTLPMTQIHRWAVDAEARGIWCPRRREAMPLPELPDAHLVRIRFDVEQDKRPPYWIDLGLAMIPSRSWHEWHWQRGIDPDSRRPAIPTRIRLAVMARDGLVCHICFGVVEPNDVHLDHIKPWSRGGEHSVANLRVTHSLCNMRKAAKYAEHHTEETSA